MSKTLTTYQKNALDYSKHIVLTANAGSGKTFVFAERFVKIALSENPELDKLVAITFTEKAAGELYSGIAKKVESKRIENKDNYAILSLLNKIRKHLVSAKISTIHSFCIDLLREFSPEAGIDANFTPLDPALSATYLEKSFDDVYSDLLKSDSVQLKNMVRYFGSKNMLKEALFSGIRKRVIADKIMKSFYVDGNYSFEKINETTEHLFNIIIPSLLQTYISNITEINNIVLSENPGNKTAESVAIFLNKLEQTDSYLDKLILLNDDSFKSTLFTNSLNVKVRGYTQRIESSELQRLLDTVNNETKFLLSFNYKTLYDFSDKLSAVANDFFFLLKKIKDHYDEKKNQSGSLDFDDILIITERIVNRKDVAEKLRQKYKYIMIDEYQDTNELQHDIFIPILDGLKSGNLFVVGDVKQSIYRFNNAELEVFRETANQISKHDGALLELPHSFRLAPNIALFTNTIFSKLFSNPNPVFNEVEFSELASARKLEEKGDITFLLTNKEDDSPSEAKMIADKIIELTSSEKRIAFGDIAILFRKNKDLTDLEKELSREKIPYSVVGGRGYYQEMVVGDIHNYLSFLISQSNDAALLGLLRSPFYAFPDSLIFNISLETGGTLWDKVKTFSVNSEFTSNAVKLIQKHIMLAETSDISLLLSSLLEDTSYWSVIASKENAKQEIANTKKLIRFSVEAIESETTSLYDFTQKLGTAIKETTDEGFAQLEESDKSVKLLTIHKSKGLEFDTVFLYRLNDALKNENLKSKSVSLDKEFGFVSTVPDPNGYFKPYVTPTHLWLYNYYNKRKESAEAQRLLYVAITRAVNSLYLTATLGKNGKVNNSSFLKMIQDGLQTDLTGDKLFIENYLPFINLENNKIEREKIGFNIDLIYNYFSTQQLVNSSESVIPKTIITNPISSTEHEEIISATKITLFRECPLKYHLTYDLGYGVLDTLLNQKLEVPFDKENIEEESDMSKAPSNIKGMLLHKLLEMETTVDSFTTNFNSAIEELFETDKLSFDLENLRKETKQILYNFFNSSIYKWLTSFSDFRNEFEMYHKLNDFYLYGIIDKIIYDKTSGAVIIVDYKSDAIKEKDISKKFAHYEIQLKLYAYLAHTVFSWANKFIIRLIFLKTPDIELSKEFSVSDLDSFSHEVTSIVNLIRNEKFIKNLDSCNDCYFHRNGNCIADL